MNVVQPRKLTLYVTVLLGTILIFLSSKLHYEVSVFEIDKHPVADIFVKPASRNTQDENIYDFEDFDDDIEAGSEEKNRFPYKHQILSQGNVEDTENRLARLTNETRTLKDAIRTYNNVNTKQYYLKDYISSLDALTARHENLLQEFHKLQQNPNFTDFIQENAEENAEVVNDVRNVVPIQHSIKVSNLFSLDGTQTQKQVPKQCQKPVQNVAFMKIHKAGSSTVQNILQRYALQNDLNVALPNKNKSKDPHYHYLGNNGKLSVSDLIPIKPNQSYNMLFNHAVYNRQKFQAILPAKTFYFAIVREPEERFVSAAFYYGLVKKLFTMIPKLNTTRYIFTTYLQNPNSYIVNHYFYNAMSYDFGVPQSSYDKPLELLDNAKRLAKEFDLVMLLEYFDHSLVLLKRRLCWDFKDILYLPRNKGSRNNSYLMSENDKIRLRNWQTAEFVLYKVFSNVFWSKVSKEGEDFYQEVAYFQDVLSYVKAFCKSATVKKDLSVKESPWSSAFSVNAEECRKMASKEVELHDVLVKRAWEKMGKKV